MTQNRNPQPDVWEANDPQFSARQSKPKPEAPQKSSRVLEAVAWGLLAISLLYFVLTYMNLPHEVPVHFGPDGKADAWGSKKEFLVGPIILTASTVLIIVLARFPQIHNFPLAMHTASAWQQFYTYSRNMVLWLAIGMGCIGLNITFSTAHPENTSLGNILWPLIILFLPIVYYIVKMVRLAGKSRQKMSMG